MTFGRVFRRAACAFATAEFAFPIWTLTHSDANYAARRDNAVRLPTPTPTASTADQVESWLAFWRSTKLVSKDEEAALETALAVYGGNLKPGIEKRFAEAANLECPMFIFSGRERIARGWRGVAAFLEIKPTLKTVSKVDDAMFVEIDSKMTIRAINYTFNFKSSVLLELEHNPGKDRLIATMHHRWFGGCIPGAASYPDVLPVKLFDALRLASGSLITLVPI